MTDTRRAFLQTLGLGCAAVTAAPLQAAPEKVIPGFEKIAADPTTSKGWKAVSDRKIRVDWVCEDTRQKPSFRIS